MYLSRHTPLGARLSGIAAAASGRVVHTMIELLDAMEASPACKLDVGTPSHCAAATCDDKGHAPMAMAMAMAAALASDRDRIDSGALSVDK